MRTVLPEIEARSFCVGVACLVLSSMAAGSKRRAHAVSLVENYEDTTGIGSTQNLIWARSGEKGKQQISDGKVCAVSSESTKQS